MIPQDWERKIALLAGTTTSSERNKAFIALLEENGDFERAKNRMKNNLPRKRSAKAVCARWKDIL